MRITIEPTTPQRGPATHRHYAVSAETTSDEVTFDEVVEMFVHVLTAWGYSHETADTITWEDLRPEYIRKAQPHPRAWTEDNV